jgi:hypothetical protein
MVRGSPHGGMISPVDGPTRNRDPFCNAPAGHTTTQHYQHTYSHESSSTRQQYTNSSSLPRGYNSRTTNQTSATTPDFISASPCEQQTAEDETVRFIAESWLKVEEELRKASADGYGGPDFYTEKEKLVRNHIPDFVQFDLEGWHAKRLNRF